MIIGISGKKRVGKDLVGKIIQYLLIDWDKVIGNYDIDKPLTFEQYQNSAFNGTNLSGWEIKKFADKLKEIVALLIGCSREDLENEFKSKELGEEWWFYKWDKFVYSLDEEKELEKDYYDYYEEELSDSLKQKMLHKPTVRFMLQYIGTDLFRNQLQPNVWVNSLISEYKKQVVQFGEFVDGGAMMIRKYPDWIISDLRFKNELKAIKEKGGITIRVNRDRFQYNERGLQESVNYLKSLGIDVNKNTFSTDGYSTVHRANAIYYKKQHISETELDNETFDYYIDNNGTVNELIEKVREILIKEKLL